jgi:hypothetical protein
MTRSGQRSGKLFNCQNHLKMLATKTLQYLFANASGSVGDDVLSHKKQDDKKETQQQTSYNIIMKLFYSSQDFGVYLTKNWRKVFTTLRGKFSFKMFWSRRRKVNLKGEKLNRSSSSVFFFITKSFK